MKLTTLLLLVTIMQVSATGYAQRLTLKQKNISIARVFEEIEKQTGYDVFYLAKVLKTSKTIDANFENASLEEVMKACLKSQPVLFAIDDRTIVITKKEPSLNVEFQNSLADISITGKIVDENGLPLPGATVTEKGTRNAISTNAQGVFTLTVKDNNSILVVNLLGFQTKEVGVGNIQNGTISLVPSQEQLGEVVITAYGTVKKSTLTDAITTIDSKKLENRPLRTMADGLIGLAPGLNIRIPSGAPESVPSLNIRGFTGFGTSGSPLVLVDGVERPIQDVNPNDVETISLLKDGAASVIYGSRAPYGVLLITTKSGKAGTLAVNYTSNYRYASIARLPQQNHSYDWAGYINQLLMSNPDGTGTAVFTDLTIQRMRAWSAGDFDNPVFAGIDRKYVLNGQFPDPTSSYGYNFFGSFADENYIKAYFRDNVPSNQQNISFSGGSENIKYYGSLGYSHVNGGLKGFDNYDKRYNALSKVDIKATDWLSFNASMNYVKQGFQGTNYRGSGIDYNTLFSVVGREYFNVPVRNPDNPDYYTSVVSVGTAQGAGGLRTVSGNDLTFTGGFKLNPIKGLDVEGSYSWRAVNNQDETTQKLILAYFPNGTTKVGERTANSSSVGKTYDALEYQFYKLSAGYTKSIADKHNFYAQIGVQGEENLFRNLSGSGQDIFSPNTVTTISTTAGNYRAGDRVYDWATLGFYGVFTYDYDQKYMVKFAARRDASSRFAEGARWGFFPSVSAGWNVARENFWPVKDLVSTFKLTGSYSKSGDLASAGSTNYYTSYPTLASGTSAQTILGGVFTTFVNPPGLVSSTLTWAKPTMLNLGLELDALKNRLNFKFEWYQRTVYDQAGPPEPVAQALGTAAPSTNNSVSETRGWELSLSWNDRFNFAGKPVQYGASFNMADYVGYVVSYKDNGTGTRDNQWTPGQVFGANYMYEGNGTIQNTGDLYNRVLTGSYNYPGYFSYKDLNGDGIINSGGGGGWYSLGDTKLNGYNYPRKTYSITPNISWNGIHLSTIFDGVMQWTVFSNSPYTFGTDGSQWFAPFYKQTTDLGYWNTNNRDAFFPAVNQGRTANDKYALNLSHLRVRSVTLGYDLPKQWLSKVKLQKVHVYLSGENMGFVYSKSYLKYDPELLNVSGNGYPPMKFYSLGLNIGL
ncbi:SusC/RagA family TonB-linked outer membrane protein [Pedobacter frigoris]|uniref:SusC/RagA family TonB-linked outer membrane protein n=1 Tax=Pedobacter frigoris TaxID=2571272 RepID=UPI0029307E80|nr:SusC/RagA family TonB-linked outer membrane protein [Pedobacter frigoris]